MHHRTHRFGLACAILALAATAAAQPIGRVVVNNDEWTLSNTGFTRAPDTAQFAANVAAWFTGGQPGRFLVYSNNFGLVQSSLAAAMTNAGHTWTVDTTVPFDVPTLLSFDAVFVTGPVGGAPDNSVLINYVESGGSVYVSAGTGTFGGAAGEPAAWNQFLNRHGLAYDTVYNPSNGTIAITSTHAIFANVQSLYFFNGNDVLPHVSGVGTSAVLDGGLFGVAEVPAVQLAAQAAPSPVTAGQNVTLSLSGGLPMATFGLFLDDLNGIRLTPSALVFGSLSAAGTGSVTLPVPPGTGGLAVGLFGATISPNGLPGISFSPRETLAIQ